MFNKQQLCDIGGRLDKIEAGIRSDGTASLQAALKALEASQDGLHDRHTDLVERIDRLTLALAEGIEKVERKERRIDAVIGRARKELKDSGLESPALEAEAHELRIVHGTGSEESGMPPVREEVEEPPRLAPKEYAVRAKFFGAEQL